MTQHYWGEEDFDWDSLGKACNFFQKNVPRWCRWTCFTKEKYGTMRLEWFGINDGIRGLIKPQTLRMTSQTWWPRIKLKPLVIARGTEHETYIERTPTSIWWLADNFLTVAATKVGLVWGFHKYQRAVFNLISIIAVKRWPHIKDEILDEYYFNDLLYTWNKKYLNYVSNWETITR